MASGVSYFETGGQKRKQPTWYWGAGGSAVTSAFFSKYKTKVLLCCSRCLGSVSPLANPRLVVPGSRDVQAGVRSAVARHPPRLGSWVWNDRPMIQTYVLVTRFVI